jgi:hypothetical protein
MVVGEQSARERISTGRSYRASDQQTGLDGTLRGKVIHKNCKVIQKFIHNLNNLTANILPNRNNPRPLLMI